MEGGKGPKLWAPTENRDESRKRGAGLNGQRTWLTSPTEVVRCPRSQSHPVAKGKLDFFLILSCEISDPTTRE